MSGCKPCTPSYTVTWAAASATPFPSASPCCTGQKNPFGVVVVRTLLRVKAVFPSFPVQFMGPGMLSWQKKLPVQQWLRLFPLFPLLFFSLHQHFPR